MGLATLVTAWSCGADSSALMVTVTGKPAVPDLSLLKIAVKIDGHGASRDYSVTSLPQSFSVSSETLTGNVTLSATAYAAKVTAATGSVTATLGQGSATLELLPADFVVHQNLMGDQFLVPWLSSEGLARQLVSSAEGRFDVLFRDECPGNACTLFGRRFDATGRPLTTAAASSRNIEWNFDRDTVDTNSIPIGVASSRRTVVLWLNKTAGKEGIYCQSVGTAGDRDISATRVVSEANASELAATVLANGNMAMAWRSAAALKLQVITDGCQVTAGTLINLATFVSNDAPKYEGLALAANRTNVLASWKKADAQGYAWGRILNAEAGNPAAEKEIAKPRADGTLDAPNIASFGSGWVVAYAERDTNNDTERLILQRISLDLMQPGPATIVDSGVHQIHLPALAPVSVGGPLLVAWSACAVNQPACDAEVYARLLHPTGLPVGPKLQVNTASERPQEKPSAVSLSSDASKELVFAVAFTDDSRAEPDVASRAVRARIVYPPYLQKTGGQGAPCDAAAPCGAELTCLKGSDGAARCTASCTPNSATACPLGGTCVTDDAGSGCKF